MFVRGTPCSSWVLCGLGNKEGHKAATRNCVPQVEERYLQTCALLSLLVEIALKLSKHYEYIML